MKTPILYTEDGGETELPFRWIICSHCEGHGKSSAYLGAFTRQQLEEEGSEFIEEYFSGGYDRACEHCDGAGKIKVADKKRMTKEQRDDYAAQCEADREIRAIERQERLMEGDWREEGWYDS